MTDIIIAPPIDLAIVAVTQGAKDEASRLLAGLKLIQRVHNPLMQARAAEAASKARGFTKRVEDARKFIKAPSLQLGSSIDTSARVVSQPIETEIARVEKLLTSYVIAENKRIEDEQKAVKKAADEAKAKADAEAARILAESQAKAAVATTPHAAQQALDLGAASAKQVVAAAAAVAPVVVLAPPRPSGMQVRPNRWNYKVTDLKKLALHDWNLVRIEAVASAIREKIDNGARDIPGLEIFEETKVNTRAS